MSGMGWKKAVAMAGIAATAVGFGVVKSGQIMFFLPNYVVSRVIDGDTFVTKEGQYVRLASVDAPEMGNCLSQESRGELERLVFGKKVYLKAIYKDSFGRMISLVYTPDGYVNERMLVSGLAVYANRGTEGADVLLAASEKARAGLKGVFSSKCTQKVNLENSRCGVKGNLSRDGKIYRVKACRLYDNTVVQLHLGDKWFCRESEAIKAGFREGGDC